MKGAAVLAGALLCRFPGQAGGCTAGARLAAIDAGMTACRRIPRIPFEAECVQFDPMLRAPSTHFLHTFERITFKRLDLWLFGRA
jgi:hypothetical protein